MARKRMIVPEIWSDSKVAELAIKEGNEAVTAFIGIFSLADDEGCFEANPYNIIIKLPSISRSWSIELVTNWLRTMNEIGLIQLYTGDDEKEYLFLPGWFKNQTIPKPYPSSLPKPSIELIEKHQNYKDNIIKMYLKMKERYENELAKSKLNQDFWDYVPYEFKLGYELVMNWLDTSKHMKGKEKKRKERKRKELLQEEGHEESSCSSEESQNEIREVYHAYQNAGYGMINQMTKDMIVHLVEEYGAEWVIEAIKIGLKNNKRKLTYVEGILQNWKRNGGMKTSSKEDESNETDTRDSPKRDFGF